MKTNFLTIVLSVFMLFNLFSQGAIEDIIIEEYHVVTKQEAEQDSNLVEGAVTYRVYIDLAENYELEAVFGNSDHEMMIATSTTFYNQSDRGGNTGYEINRSALNKELLYLDSWITVGAATKYHMGILRSNDKNGSLLEAKGFKETDGLKNAKVYPITVFGLDLELLDENTPVNAIETTNGAWAILGSSLEVADDQNRVLIAQLTTGGELSYKLNIQVGNDCDSEKYVWNDPKEGEHQFVKLSNSE